MKRGQVFKSNFIKKEDLESPVGSGRFGVLKLTISGVEDGSFDDGTTQRVLTFENDDRRFGLNATNWDAIAEICGSDDDDDFVGLTIELYVDPTVKMRGKTVGGVRVRRPSGAAESAKSNKPPASAPPDDSVPPDDGAVPGSKPMTKQEAWGAYCTAYTNKNPKATQPEIIKAWQAAVADQKRQTGKEPAAFDGNDWAAIVASVEIPF